MSKEDESRRAFLKGAAAGAGVVATAALAPDTLAQNRKSDAPAMAHFSIAKNPRPSPHSPSA